MTIPSTSPSEGLDLRIIFEIPLRQFVPWLFSVILVSVAGYPGVVCVTPLAWLLALRVGNLVSWQSKSVTSSRRLIEAALAGGFFGLLQGILFAAVTPFMGRIQPNETTRAIAFAVIMMVVGVFAGASLSFFTAYLIERRR